MTIGLELVTPPVGEPVTLAEMKAFARVEHSDDDALLQGLIAQARQWVEDCTGRALLPQTWRLWLDAWPDSAALELPKPPLRSVTTVTIYAADDSSAVWNAANYQVDSAALPGRLVLRGGQSWPVQGRTAQGIRIDFVAGYADAASVPEPIKLALRQLALHWYEQRGDVAAQAVPSAILHLLAIYRLVRL